MDFSWSLSERMVIQHCTTSRLYLGFIMIHESMSEGFMRPWSGWPPQAIYKHLQTTGSIRMYKHQYVTTPNLTFHSNQCNYGPSSRLYWSFNAIENNPFSEQIIMNHQWTLKLCEITSWLVVYLPLWKMWVRQLGLWPSQLNGKS